jgi:hypothetical protein
MVQSKRKLLPPHNVTRKHFYRINAYANVDMVSKEFSFLIATARVTKGSTIEAKAVRYCESIAIGF